MSTISFIIPGNPMAKQRPKFKRVGNHVRTYTPEETLNYEGRVSFEANRAVKKNTSWKFDQAYKVVIWIFVAVPQSWSKKMKLGALNGQIFPTTKPDIDNVEKIIFDGMNGIVWKDDKQVVAVNKRKIYAEMPRVHVEVSVAGNPKT